MVAPPCDRALVVVLRIPGLQPDRLVKIGDGTSIVCARGKGGAAASESLGIRRRLRCVTGAESGARLRRIGHTQIEDMAAVVSKVDPVLTGGDEDAV
jgi:hypothetical protein